MPDYIIIMGPAGSGKTLLALALSEWLGQNGLENIIINMDPAVESLPYTPDVDVREYVNARVIAEKHGLGPNGALLASMDLLYTRIKDLKEEIVDREAPLNIIDTPGQLELFAYRRTGPLLLDEIVPRDHGVVVFLIDSGFTYNRDSLISLLLLSSSIEFRHRMPQITAVSKSDLLSPEMIEYIEGVNEDPRSLISSQLSNPLKSEQVLVEAIAERGVNLIPVSSITGEGIDHLYAEIEKTLTLSSVIETNLE